jgi:FkbM family methyltransferase
MRHGRFEVALDEGFEWFKTEIERTGFEWEFWWRFDLEHLYVPGTSIIDLGGCMGLNALTFSDFGPVYTYEPVYHEYIEANCRLNTLVNSITVMPIGISSENCEINIYKPHIKAANNGIASMERSYEDGTELRVPVFRLDDVYTSDQPIGIIKIDVEMHELYALKGSINLIRKYKPVIFIELFNYSENPCVDFLKNLGYSRILSRPYDNYVFIHKE